MEVLCCLLIQFSLRISLSYGFRNLSWWHSKISDLTHGFAKIRLFWPYDLLYFMRTGSARYRVAHHLTFCHTCIQLNVVYTIVWCQKSLTANNSSGFINYRFYSTYINCFLVPCIEAQALIFSRIHVTIQDER